MIPEYWVDTYNLYTRSRVDEAQAMQQKYISMEQAVIGKYGFTETIKEALNIRGIPVGNTRRPGKRLPKSAKDDITKFLLKLGIPVN